MKRIIILISLCSLFSNACFAKCDFSEINKNPDGNYTYTKQQHICVGETLQDNEIKTQQIEKYTKAIELKDLAISKADKRAETWMETSLRLEDNIQKIDSHRKRNDWLYFGLGVITTGLAVWGAGQLK